MKKDEKMIEEKCDELKALLSTVGWTKKDLARKVADDKARQGKNDEECDEKKEYEIIKKLFTRPPKKTDKLDFYIHFIIEHRDNKKYDFIRLPKVDLNKFDERERTLLERIGKVSKAFFTNEKI